MQIVSANRLTDGIVIFLTRTADGSLSWTPRQNEACIAESDDEAATLLSAAEELETREQEATGSYLVDIVQTGTDIRATKFREHLRAEGPSVQTELNNAGHERVA